VSDASGRLVHGNLVHLEDRDLDTPFGPFRASVYANVHTHRFAVALARGDVRSAEPLLARVHSACMTSESFGGCDCDCLGQLETALAAIDAAGRGTVFYLMQEGRGAGFVAKALDRMIVQASGDRVTTFDAYGLLGLERDHRRYDEVAFIRQLLGVRAPLRLLTNNPEKVEALERDGVPVESAIPIAHDPSPYNAHYIGAKSRSGHALQDPGPVGPAARLPEPVAWLDPQPVADNPRFVHMACYLLPIRADGDAGAPVWLRLHVYFDRITRHERVVFEHGAREDAVPLLRVQRESFFERFPLRDVGADKRRWQASVRALAARGAGCALFLPCDDPAESGGREPGAGPLVAAESDPELVRLLARHLRGRRAQPLVDGPAESGRDRALRRSLAACAPEPLAPEPLAAA